MLGPFGGQEGLNCYFCLSEMLNKYFTEFLILENICLHSLVWMYNYIDIRN